MCPEAHSLRRDYRYMPGVNQRQCKWCGCTESEKIRQMQQIENKG